MKNPCSIVVRAYNEGKHIGRLLEGIRRQTVQDVEIILVDSGSTDATVCIAAQCGAKVVHIPPAEFTFGRSLNLGMAATSNAFVVIASAHVYPVYPDWLERLLEPMADSTVALVYGKQRGPASANFSERQIYHQWYSEHSDLRQNHPFCNNANAVIRRSLWEIHPYDETLTGLEDLEWAKWAMEEGHSIAYVSEAEVIHVHQETPSGVFHRYLREAMAFKRIYPEAHFNLWDFFRLATSNILSDLGHAARQRGLIRNALGIFWFRFMQFHGTRMGYKQSGPLTWQLRQTFYYPRRRVELHNSERKIEPIHYED